MNIVQYTMYIKDFCTVYTDNFNRIYRDIVYAKYIPSIFLYMHDIYHAYTMYIKEF